MPNGHTYLRNGSISRGNVYDCSIDYASLLVTEVTPNMFHGKRNPDVMFLIEKGDEDRAFYVLHRKKAGRNYPRTPILAFSDDYVNN